MLIKSDVSIATLLSRFAKHSIDVGLLVPTETAIYKSIIDAHGQFREFLERNDIHCYDSQGQGQAAKKNVDAYFVYDDHVRKTTASLYRPETKLGDPRVWFYGLKDYASACNLIACIWYKDVLFLVNASRPTYLDFFFSSDSPISELLALDPIVFNEVGSELLDKLKGISRKGFIQSIKSGDTGIGMTLEAELGLAPNSSRKPDYKGIEIKASRRRPGKVNRMTLFSKVPDWKNSPVRNAVSLLKKRGEADKNGRLNLYHTVSALSVNSFGLRFEVDEERQTLRQVYVGKDGAVEHDTSWSLVELRRSLSEKHPDTFWVKALCRKEGEQEFFHFCEAVYTRRPRVEHLGALIEAGVVTMDYTMHLKDTGTSVRDHGYLFKVLPSNLDAIFPEPIIYS